MMTMSRRQRRRYANDNDALVPELWARYSIAVLMSNMVAGRLVYRDFENQLASFGDVVNTRRPAGFVVHRKTDTDNVTVQDASLTNVQVQLNMHPHVSFLIRDGEESVAMESLIETHLRPAMIAMAEHIDSVVLAQYSQFLLSAGQAGQLGGLSSSNYQSYLAELDRRLNDAKCPANGRQLIVPPSIKQKILTNQPLVGVDQAGNPDALRQAALGRIYGFDHYMSQNMASFSGVDVTSSAFLINNAAGYDKGATSLTVDGGTGALAVGQFFKLGGKIYQILTHTETLGNTTAITIPAPGLWEPVANNDPLTVYDPAAVDLLAGYAAGWAKAIAYDGTTLPLKAGQTVSFGLSATSAKYVIVSASATEIVLDRPLEAALLNDAVINVSPPGDIGMAFRRDAIALVVRPLKLPRAGAGAMAGSASFEGFSIRVVITYDGDKQGHLVTIDCLMGIKVLEQLQGAVLLG